DSLAVARPPRPGDDLPEVPAEAALRPLRKRPGTGRRPGPLPGRRADRGPAGEFLRALAAPVGTAHAPGGGGTLGAGSRLRRRPRPGRARRDVHTDPGRGAGGATLAVAPELRGGRPLAFLASAAAPRKGAHRRRARPA